MDPTPAPTPTPDGVATLSVEEINLLETRIRENKQAQLRGEPLPHIITVEDMARAVNGIRASRGTLEMAGARTAAGSKSKSGGKSNIEILDLEGL